MARPRKNPYACYGWWPRAGPLPAEYKASTIVIGAILGELAMAPILSLPAVVRATGVSATTIWVLIVCHLTCVMINLWVIAPRADRSHAAFHVVIGFALTYNLAVCMAFAILPEDPKTIWWMAPIIYAITTGAIQELSPSIIHLVVFTAVPLTTIPWFRAQGADPDWAIAGPVIASILSGFTYDLLTRSGAYAHEERARLQRQVAALERNQLARDLHDGVGSALAMLGVYGDLVERYIDQPAELARIAGELRGATREGLDQLRGVLDALAPETGDFAALGSALTKIAQRAPSSVAIDVVVAGEPSQLIPPRVRLAVVRILQEAIANAIRHGAADAIDVQLSVRDGRFELDIRDHGSGFDPATVGVGRGMPSMRERTTEIGGSFTVSSSTKGTIVSVRAPLS